MGREPIRPLYLGNFEYDATSREIERLCERYGDLDHVDMKTGFAFVYYKDSRDADDAIRALDGKEFGYKRRRLRCEYSKGDGEIKRREDKRREVIRPTTTLFVVNFNVEDTRERDLERLYERYGRLVRVQIKRTYAFVQFEKVEQAEAALKDTHLSRFMGRTISVEYVCKEPGEAGVRGYGGGGGGSDYGRSDRDRDRYRSRSRSPVRRPRSRSPSYGRKDSPRRSLSPRGRSLSPRRSLSRSRSRSPRASRSPRRSLSRSRSPL